MNNYILNKLYLIFALIFGAVLASTAVAATGAYVFLGGGGVYFLQGKIGNTTINRHPVNFNVSDYSIVYNQTKAFDYLGRVAWGYMFYENLAQTRALGAEAGFDYFGPLKTRVVGYLGVPLINLTIPVTTTERTTNWLTDVEAVFRQSLGSVVSLIVKLGAAYQLKTSVFTNSVPDLPGELPESETLLYRSVVVIGGVGIECAMSQHSAFRIEINGLKGGAGAGATQGLIGVVLSF